MERGNLAGVSDGVLEAVAGALRLDEAERAHLFDLAAARVTRQQAGADHPARWSVRPTVEWMIDAMTGVAAFAVDGQQDILAANQLGRAFYAPRLESAGPANMAGFTYLDPRAQGVLLRLEPRRQGMRRCAAHPGGTRPRRAAIYRPRR